MSSTEKPSFFSKLFGRSVSRPSSSSTSGSSSNSNSGSLSSPDDYSNTNGSSPATSKPLRYLSPTAIESSFSRASSRPVETNSDAARKRPIESPQATSGFTNGSFYLSETAKRFKSGANTSLISEPVARLELPRLDTTWSVGMGMSSPSNLSYSPNSSVRSLRSRITRPSSRTSVLSSKTAALLGQIERVSTPAQDARKMPMLRFGLNKERWNSLGSSSISVPPLSRVSTVPSRYQVMSSLATPMQKKPYWRDVARERTEDLNEEHRVSSVPTLPVPITTHVQNGEKNGVKEHVRASTHQPVLKGTDGSNVNREKNKFSANDISLDDSADMEALRSVKGPDASQIVFALPTTGFLGKDVKPSFSFKKPMKVVESMEESESSEESESEESGSSESDSGSGEDEDNDNGHDDDRTAKTKTTESTSDTSSSAENTSKETSNEEPKKSSPPRTIASSIVASSVSKPSTLMGAASSTISTGNWDCPSCYVGNKSTDMKCACCGESNPSQKSAPPAVNWDCSSCCVPNKGADMKCVCCGEVKPGAVAAPAATDNVFGAKAFKPTSASSSTFSFGFGNGSVPSAVSSTSNNSSSVNAAPKLGTTGAVTFGFKSLTESATPSTTSIPTITVTQPVTAVPTASIPMFGSTSNSTPFGTSAPTGSFSFGFKNTTANGDTKESAAVPSVPAVSVAAPSSSLFSSSVKTATPAAAPLFGLAPVSSTSSSSAAVPPVATSSLFGSSTLSVPSSIGLGVPSSVPSIPLFGSSSTTSTSTALSTPTPTPTPSTTVPLFGSTVSTSSVPLFGSSVSSSSAPLFGSSLPSSTPLFGSTQSSSTPSIVPLFGSSLATSIAPTLNSATAAASMAPFSFGPSGVTKAPLFGASTDTKPLFGASKPSDDDGPGAKKAMFGVSTGTTTPFGGGGGGGGNNITGTNNLFGSSSSSFGGLTQSASAPSFSLPTAPPSSFNFGSQPVSTAPPPSTFVFGGSSAAASVPSSSTPFVFGAQQPTAAAPSFGSFGAPSAPSAPFAPPDAGNPFAFTSSAPSGSRKMIQAKRRLPGKR